MFLNFEWLRGVPFFHIDIAEERRAFLSTMTMLLLSEVRAAPVLRGNFKKRA